MAKVTWALFSLICIYSMHSTLTHYIAIAVKLVMFLKIKNNMLKILFYEN